MATKPKNDETVDLVEFKRMQVLVKKQSAKLIADKLAEVKRNLRELKELVEISGIVIHIQNELHVELCQISEMHPDWNSSSYEC